MKRELILSHSQIGTYKQCPARWYYKYIKRYKEKEKYFFSFGKSIHNTLEFMYNFKGGKVRSLLAVLAYYKRNWIKTGYDSQVAEARFKDKGFKMINKYYAKHSSKCRKPVAVEFPFNIEVHGIKVRGYIDRIDGAVRKVFSGAKQTVAACGLRVIDYKTGKFGNMGAAEDAPQLTMYQMAVNALFKRKVVEVGFYHVPSLTYISANPHSTEKVEELIEDIRWTADQIKDKKYEPNPSEWNCRFCDYKKYCPVFAGMS